MFSCRYSTTFGHDFANQGISRQNFKFSVFVMLAFNCYQLASGIPQANIIQVQLSSAFNSFPVFGIALKPLIEFGVVKATF